MERNPKKISTKAKILVDLFPQEMNIENGGAVTWKETYGIRVLCKMEGIVAKLMRVKNVRRSLTPLHAKYEHLYEPSII